MDLEDERALAEEKVGRVVSDSDLTSWLMYPKVYSEYIEHRRMFGDVSTLPTPVFFYGMSEESEMSVDIDQGKTLVVRYQGPVEEKDTAETTLFFELNGQPRPVSITRSGSTEKVLRRLQAEEGNLLHVAAPMPGAVVAIAVKVGQTVTRGMPLLSIEAMKMENAITSHIDGVVSKLHVSGGERVDAKDLLIELKAA